MVWWNGFKAGFPSLINRDRRKEEGGRAKGDGVRPQCIVPISNRSRFNTRCIALFLFFAAPFSLLPATIDEAYLRRGSYSTEKRTHLMSVKINFRFDCN